MPNFTGNFELHLICIRSGWNINRNRKENKLKIVMYIADECKSMVFPPATKGTNK